MSNPSKEHQPNIVIKRRESGAYGTMKDAYIAKWKKDFEKRKEEEGLDFDFATYIFRFVLPDIVKELVTLSTLPNRFLYNPPLYSLLSNQNKVSSDELVNTTYLLQRYLSNVRSKIKTDQNLQQEIKNLLSADSLSSVKEILDSEGQLLDEYMQGVGDEAEAEVYIHRCMEALRDNGVSTNDEPSMRQTLGDDVFEQMKKYATSWKKRQRLTHEIEENVSPQRHADYFLGLLMEQRIVPSPIQPQVKLAFRRLKEGKVKSRFTIEEIEKALNLMRYGLPSLLIEEKSTI